MKRIVRDDPMAWSIVCLISGLVAGATGPDTGNIYLIALAVAAIALSIVIWPDRVAQWREKFGARPKP